MICIPIQVGASRNASFEFSNIAFVWKGASAIDCHKQLSYNRYAAISDFIQFVRVTVPISSWVSTAISSIRGQAQRLLPLVLSSRRYQCAVCGQVPSALPMVRRCAEHQAFTVSVSNRSLYPFLMCHFQFSHCDHVYCYGCAAQVLRFLNFLPSAIELIRFNRNAFATPTRLPGLSPTRGKHVVPYLRPIGAALAPHERPQNMT